MMLACKAINFEGSFERSNVMFLFFYCVRMFLFIIPIARYRRYRNVENREMTWKNVMWKR